MEGTLFPNRPALRLPPSKLPANKLLKFNPITLPLHKSSSSPPPFPLDPLLQHLSAQSLTTKPTSTDIHLNSFIQNKDERHEFGSSTANQDGGFHSFDFLPTNCRLILSSIVRHPVSSLNSFFDSITLELIQVDTTSLLQGLKMSGHSDKAIRLFEWIVKNRNDENVKLDAQVIALMVRILGKESQHTIASKLFDEIPLEEYSLDVRAWTTVIHAHSRAGKYQKAIHLFQHIRDEGIDPTLVTYNVMLDVYGKMGCSWDKIKTLLDEMRFKKLKFDEFTSSTVISACGREGLVKEAETFFNEFKQQNVPRTVTYNSLLQVYARAGMYAEALSVLHEMEGNNCPPDSVTYNELVSAYVRAGFHEKGCELLEKMTIKGIMPNTVTYTTIIDSYGKTGKEDEAMSLFRQMKISGCVPNVCTYNAILGMLGKKSRLEEMMKLLHDMKSSGCSPNRITWNIMLATCGKMGMQGYVNRVFGEMKNCGVEPDRDTFNTLISAYGRCGSSIDVTQMYQELINSGFAPCVTTYNSLLNALARRGDWKSAESVILDMRNKGFKPNETSYSLMLHCYSKAKKVRGIDRISKKIYDEGLVYPSWMILRTLVIANFKCRSLKGMERAFQELQKNGYKPDLVVLNSMISIFAKNKMYKRADEILHLISESGLKPDLVTYNSLMDMYAEMGECWKAEQVLKEVEKTGDKKPDLVSYNTVIKAFCRKGLMQEAVRVLSEMTINGIRPCIFTYNTFVAGFAGQGMFIEADDVITYMIQHNCRPNELTYSSVVDGYCKARMFKEAAAFVSKIREKDNSFDEPSLQRLASKIYGDNNVKLASL